MVESFNYRKKVEKGTLFIAERKSTGKHFTFTERSYRVGEEKWATDLF